MLRYFVILKCEVEKKTPQASLLVILPGSLGYALYASAQVRTAHSSGAETIPLAKKTIDRFFCQHGMCDSVQVGSGRNGISEGDEDIPL